MDDYGMAGGFMDMRDDGRVWARLADARDELVSIAGRHVALGCRDSDAAEAKILGVDHTGHVELQVLSGTAESHCIC